MQAEDLVCEAPVDEPPTLTKEEDLPDEDLASLTRLATPNRPKEKKEEVEIPEREPDPSVPELPQLHHVQLPPITQTEKLKWAAEFGFNLGRTLRSALSGGSPEEAEAHAAAVQRASLAMQTLALKMVEARIELHPLNSSGKKELDQSLDILKDRVEQLMGGYKDANFEIRGAEPGTIYDLESGDPARAKKAQDKLTKLLVDESNDLMRIYHDPENWDYSKK